MNITLTRSCGERLTAQPTPVPRVPRHVSEECIYIQACRRCRGRSYSCPDHAWIIHVPLKCTQYMQKNHITNQKQILLLVQKLPEILNPAGWDEFHRLELFGGMFSAAGTVWTASYAKAREYICLAVGWTDCCFSGSCWAVTAITCAWRTCYYFDIWNRFHPTLGGISHTFLWSAEAFSSNVTENWVKGLHKWWGVE